MDISTHEKLLTTAMGLSYVSAAIVYVVFRSLENNIRGLIRHKKRTT